MRKLVLATTVAHLTSACAILGNTTELTSVSSAGDQGNGSSSTAGISADGRFVAFGSSATNLVAGDTNNRDDFFVHDRLTGQTTRVSVSSTGEQANGSLNHLAISAGGRFVTFQSFADNLVPGDTNARPDIFVHDRETGQTTRVSVSSAGVQGNGNPGLPAMSADGRFVAFESLATNLVPGDTNGQLDVFVHDRESGQTSRVSVSSTGVEGNGGSGSPTISADGRFVAFRGYTAATNLVPGDTNNRDDIFVHDRQTGETTRVSVSTAGEQGNGVSDRCSISADGRFVAFESLASNLVPSDTAGRDIFVHDRQMGETTRVSINSAGQQGNGLSTTRPSISADGRFVVFQSDATNFVPGDTNGQPDVFLRDRQTGQTTRVSVSSDGTQGNNLSDIPAITSDGRFVAFRSQATNLVPSDTNGQPDVFVHDRGGNACPGDTNGDNLANGSDLSVLLGQFGESVLSGSGADFNADGVVNAADLSVLLSSFGGVCS